MVCIMIGPSVKCYAFTTRKKKCYKKYEVKCEVLVSKERRGKDEKKRGSGGDKEGTST